MFQYMYMLIPNSIYSKSDKPVVAATMIISAVRFILTAVFMSAVSSVRSLLPIYGLSNFCPK